MTEFRWVIPVQDIREAVEKIDSLTGADPEADHGEADRILLSLMPPAIKDAVNGAQNRARGWRYA